MLRAFGHPAVRCRDMLGAVVSNLRLVKFFMQHFWMMHDVVVRFVQQCCTGAVHYFDVQYPTCRNTSQQGGQTYATCYTQRCCDILCWSFAMVWPELANLGRTMLRYVVLICCDRVAGGLAKWMFSSSLLWFTGLWVFFVIGRCDYLGFSFTTLKWVIGVTATKFRLNHVFKIKRSLTRFVTYL